jgi:transcriptional regulator GlxA family with amidase domain
VGRQFPVLQILEDVRWVDNDRIVTSAGIRTGIDMSLHLVERLAGRGLAERTARQMDFEWTRNKAEASA